VPEPARKSVGTDDAGNRSPGGIATLLELPWGKPVPRRNLEIVEKRHCLAVQAVAIRSAEETAGTPERRSDPSNRTRSPYPVPKSATASACQARSRLPGPGESFDGGAGVQVR